MTTSGSSRGQSRFSSARSARDNSSPAVSTLSLPITATVVSSYRAMMWCGPRSAWESASGSLVIAMSTLRLISAAAVSATAVGTRSSRTFG
ncbi:Uncharacterised protein [Mycobacteroides abscessus subsp. abscessus]|nr:Uncharacterised protein [Mycobacteroides abscessus subsp. abscessus]